MASVRVVKGKPSPTSHLVFPGLRAYISPQTGTIDQDFNGDAAGDACDADTDGDVGRLTWIEVSVLGGWMVAYENTRAVYATLIAPRRGGVPLRNISPLETASTPVGTFRVDGKFYTATMANPMFVHSDVPFSQNFSGPHVLYQAYWHDGWGEKRSAGCINFSPTDALWFFRWSEPSMPNGWYGLRSDQNAGPATLVWVHQ